MSILDEGTTISTNTSSINFVGSGVVASGSGAVTVTVSGGGGGGVTLNDNVNNYIATMTGTASTLDGEIGLQFDKETFFQQSPTLTLANTQKGGFVSNINGSLFTTTSRYPSNFFYTGETIYAKNVDINNNTFSVGQVVAWWFNTGLPGYGFTLTDSVGGNVYNTAMLAVCLQDIGFGNSGHFLLKGFVSIPTPLTDLQDAGPGRGIDGTPLYLYPTGNGMICDPGGWAITGAPGVDYYRSVGYLVTQTLRTSGAYHVIRFDPSTDYII